jgi:hypothetical protein
MSKRQHTLYGLAVFVLSLVFTTACSIAGVDGNGILKRENRTVADFTKIDVDLSGKVEIRQGAAFKVEVEAESNLLDLIETSVSGQTLHIDSKGNFNSNQPIRYYITMPNLEGVKIGGSGSANVLDVFSPKTLSLDIKGSGSIKGNFIAGEVEVDIAGSGNVYLEGSADVLEADIAGSGDINAEGMAAKKADIDVAGSGSIKVHAVDELEVDIAGSGSVKYMGNPSKLKTDIAGSGRISKL